MFAAFSTVIAVFENIMSFWLEMTKMSRKKVAIINIILMIVYGIIAIIIGSIVFKKKQDKFIYYA